VRQVTVGDNIRLTVGHYSQLIPVFMKMLIDTSAYFAKTPSYLDKKKITKLPWTVKVVIIYKKPCQRSASFEVYMIIIQPSISLCQ
jgi:hypothetical protein